MNENMDDFFKYVGLVNLEFDKKITSSKLLEIKDILFSPNTIKQIEFKDSIFKEDVANIKYYLELSPYIVDSRVEKNILTNDLEIKKELSKLNYLNPNTWNISYLESNNNYKVTSIVKYKVILENLNLLESKMKEDFSIVDKIKVIYDYLTKFKENNIESLDDVFVLREANMKSLNRLFKYILAYFNIKSEIIKKNEHYVTYIYIKDNKYDIDGYYLFNPFLDLDKFKISNIYKELKYSNFMLSKEEYMIINDISIKSSTGKIIEEDKKKQILNI